MFVDVSVGCRFTARTRVWQVTFDDIADPLKGGSISAVVEGSEQPVEGTAKMVDNLVASCDGSVYLQVLVQALHEGPAAECVIADISHVSCHSMQLSANLHSG